MKKALFVLAFISGFANAAPWDLNAQQYDQFGTSMINRLLPLPTGGADGIYVYEASSNLPRLATYDSTIRMTGQVIGVNPATLAGKFDTPTGNSGQYVRGDGTLATFPTGVSYFSNDANYVTSSALTTTLGNYATTGALTSGLATKFNSPSGTSLQYVRGDGTLFTFPTAVSSFTNDSNYLNQAGARNAISLTTTGSGAATYNSSTGVLNVPTPAGAVTPSQASATRSLNTIYQVSSTRPALAFYSVQCTITATISGGQNCDVIFEIASDSGFTANVQTVSICGDGQTYTLAVALQGVQPTTKMCGGWIPAGYYARLRTVQNTGAPTFSYRAGQEITM